MTADEIIRLLDLQPHPEGGCFRETWRAGADPGERAAGTAIYFLLSEGEVSRWHRVDSAEIWHHYAGADVELTIAAGDGTPAQPHRLGPDVLAGARPQVVVPPAAWQSARSLGAWSLVGCTVSPGFEFERFELAPPGFAP